jgi:transglutaminase-like putative cysteine protease
MQIRIGYEMIFDCPQPTPMILTLSVHYTRASDIVVPDHLITHPSVPLTAYRDGFGNWCSRIVAPRGEIRLTTDAIVRDSGQPDTVATWAQQFAVPDLPEETLVFLLGSRYCETDRLSAIAWSLFGTTPPGWARVQAICSWVHDHITFGYHFANPSKSAFDVYGDGQGVCRDFSHLALTFCRCLNIPARYVTGYMGDIGVPVVLPMDFSGWFEVYLGDRWYTFDARHNTPRIGRVVMAVGRDAADVALTTNFGSATLKKFFVISDEIGTNA